jgi:hypothetical protein
MTSSSRRFDVHAAGRALGAIGVILSLLFVGLELRQSRQLARAEVRQGLVDRDAGIINAVAANPELARAWAVRWELAGPRPDEALTFTDSIQAQIALLELLRSVENVYLQFREGVVDESVLDTYGFNDSPVFKGAKFKEYWPSLRSRFDPRFVAAFEAEYGI